MSRGKAPPFKQRVQAALEAARAAGFTRLKVKTADGASFEFDTTTEAEAKLNDFDRPPNSIPPKRRNTPT
jgi:hypothetical protein